MTTDLRPAEAWLPLDVDEQDYVKATFEDLLDTGETVASVYDVTCEAVPQYDERDQIISSTDDPDASSRLSGSAVLESPEVAQLMAGVLDGVNYLVRFIVTTSASRRLVIAGTVLGTRVGGAAP